MRQAWLWLALVCAALCFCGCRSAVVAGSRGWTPIVSPEESEKLSQHLRVEWAKQLPVQGIRDVYLDGDLVYVETTYGLLVALEAATGNQVWVVRSRVPLDYPPCSLHNEVFTFSAGNLRVLDRTSGKVLRERNPLLGMTTQPFAGELYVLATSAEGKVHGIGLRSLWPEWTKGIESVPVAAAFLFPDMYYMLTVDGDLRRYEVESGEVKWQVRFPGKHPLVAPCLTQDAVYIGARDNFAYAFTHFGAPLWRRVVGGAAVQPPVLARGNLILIVDPENAVVLSPADGSILWKRTGPARFLTASRERAYFLDAKSQKLLCFGLADGKPQGQLDTRSYRCFCAAPEAGRFIAATTDGFVYSIADVSVVEDGRR